ncbi:hypothetical protein J8273_1726 [Carpediemonas membranifera]|uniref:Uncharacterized protein n=1 Tax=Carpediemonas membranifera TaxID=201153 RepID=A0A8J6B6I7_9EUKA|nr:hypothetical protein J8273_1726 [Carpediemonas membranifera]|eukprot:KAG9396708.1 hypothetical protein J8273_1726 [Carpediemonas membranifera]
MGKQKLEEVTLHKVFPTDERDITPRHISLIPAMAENAYEIEKSFLRDEKRQHKLQMTKQAQARNIAMNINFPAELFYNPSEARLRGKREARAQAIQANSYNLGREKHIHRELMTKFQQDLTQKLTHLAHERSHSPTQSGFAIYEELFPDDNTGWPGEERQHYLDQRIKDPEPLVFLPPEVEEEAEVVVPLGEAKPSGRVLKHVSKTTGHDDHTLRLDRVAEGLGMYFRVVNAILAMKAAGRVSMYT